MASNSNLLIAVLAVVVVILAYVAYGRLSRAGQTEDSLRKAARKVEDAINPRTPAGKIRDGVKDSIRDIKN
jgi:hypothetical protein